MAYIVLDSLSNLHNYKIIMRNAKCLDMGAIVVSKNKEDINTTRINKIARKEQIVVSMQSTKEFIEHLKLPLVCLEYTEKATNIDEFTFPKKCYIVVGNERDGIQKEILQKADNVVKITCKCKNILKVAAVATIAQWKWVS